MPEHLEFPHPDAEHPIITIQQHILEQQMQFPGVSGEFSALLSSITLATKMIQAKVRRAGLTDILGAVDSVNVQGEVQQKLDIYANQVMMHSLHYRESVAVMASEENENPITIRHDNPNAKYIVFFDPLDGSSNIDVNVSVGTTFSIMKRPTDENGVLSTTPEDDMLQPGYKQVAAGYVVYGSSTILVYSVGDGVHGFTLDPAVGAYVLSHENMQMPDQGIYYSVNEANMNTFPPVYNTFIENLKGGALGNKYSSRYIGSMVADFHRTLLRGGVFMYPPTHTHPQGKLRMMYEANPIAYIAEQANGVASNGNTRMLDASPEHIHQRTPLIVGSKTEMAEFERCLKEEPVAVNS